VLAPRKTFSAEALSADWINYFEHRRRDNDDNDDGRFIYLSKWCEIDLYFPCSDYSVAFFGDSQDIPRLQRLVRSQLCPSGCEDSYWGQGQLQMLPYNDVAVHLREMAQADHFSLAFVPIEMLYRGDVDFSGLIPIDIVEENSRVSDALASGTYSFFEDVFIYAIPAALDDKRYRDFLTYLYAPRHEPTAFCYNNDPICLANMGDRGTRAFYWHTPIKH
jgi:hypothetical protein